MKTIVLVLFVCGGRLFAQQPAVFAQEPAAVRLTLRDAVNLALKQNPQVILANLNVSQSEQDRAIARAALLPQANAGISDSAHRINIQAAIGFNFPNIPQHAGPFWVIQGGPNVTAPVFDLTLWRRYRAAKLDVEAGRSQELSAREDSVLLVVSQYLGSQRAAADVRAAQSRVDLAQALYDQAADLQRNGVGTGIDTLRANVQLQNEKQRLIVSRTSLETSLDGLARLLSLDPRQRVELADEESVSEALDLSENETLAQAYEARPDLREILARERRAEVERIAAGDQRLPKLTFNGEWLEQGVNPHNLIPVYTYQGSIDVPLFTGGRIQAERAKADLAIRQLRQQERDLRDRIALGVKTAIANLASARSEVEVANLGIELAQQEVEQARDRFQAGVANNIEVITAQDELARADDNRITAIYHYNQSRADVAHATGRIEALYTR
jgi:outer membrane protein